MSSAALRVGRVLAVAICALVYAAPAGAQSVTLPATSSSPALSGYVARPKAAMPAAAVLVLHGCGGLGKLEERMADDLAAHGYVGLAIDTLTPQGLKNSCGVYRTATVGATYASTALAWLAAQPYVDPKRIGVMGFSEGAIEVLDLIDPSGPPLAIPSGLRAAVAYYPACRNRKPAALVPLQILDGSADDWTPAPPCASYAQAATAAGSSVQITTYPDATHAFNQPSQRERIVRGHTLRYDPAATFDADGRTMLFFAQHLH